MENNKHERDHTMFAVPSVVLIHLETSELYLVDKVTYGLGTIEEGNPIDPIKVKSLGFEILGEL